MTHQNTFGPTEGPNEQWQEANRRPQRQTIRYRGIVPTPNSPPALPPIPRQYPCRPLKTAKMAENKKNIAPTGPPAGARLQLFAFVCVGGGVTVAVGR